jgi:hypothetical protein
MSTTNRESAAQHNAFICTTGIHGTTSNVAQGLKFLSYAVGCSHEVYDGDMANGLDMLLQTMGKALSFENGEGSEK